MLAFEGGLHERRSSLEHFFYGVGSLILARLVIGGWPRALGERDQSCLVLLVWDVRVRDVPFRPFSLFTMIPLNEICHFLRFEASLF